MGLYAKRTFRIDSENAFKMGPRIAKLEAQGKEIIKLNLGEPDFNIPEFVKEEIKRQIDCNNTHYCDPKGILTLREAIAFQIEETRGLTISPEQVVIFPGAKPAIGFSQQVYCEANDEVIYPSPGFPIYESFIPYLGAIPKPLHLNEAAGFTFTAEQLERLISPKTKLIFLNFPSNPTGGIATKEQLEKIANVILHKCSPNVRVYSDEIYENIIFENQKHVSIASVPGMEKITIISSGFSKSFAWTGGRVGYAIFPSIEEADIFKNLNINYFSCVSPYNQEAAKVALLHPESKSTLATMVGIFESRRNQIVKMLNTIPGVSCRRPEGAFYVFPNIQKACQHLGILEAYEKLNPEIKQKTSPTTLFQMFALYYHNVAIMDRRSFGKIGSENEHYIRLSTATGTAKLEAGIQNLQHAFQDTPGFQHFIKNNPIVY